jgi:group I intron endonuclease
MAKSILAVSGIYAIRNTVNAKRYVGSALNIKERLAPHMRRLARNSHHSQKLQAAWNKYGAECFVAELLEIVVSPESLLTVEQAWIDLHQAFESGYNMRPRASSQLGYRMSDASKLKISLANKGKKQLASSTELTRIAHTGSKRSDEARARMSVAQQAILRTDEEKAKKAAHMRELAANNVGKRRSDAIRTKISESSKGKVISTQQREQSRLRGLGKKQPADFVARRIAAGVAGKAAKKEERERLSRI